MCVNDVAVQGAEPLFFLDYYATGKLDVDVAESVIAGIAEGCQLAGCALVGGETAEMPGMYHGADYDLAGFCVGVVERSEHHRRHAASQAGDAIIGLASSGVHSNGYSLVRKLHRGHRRRRQRPSSTADRCSTGCSTPTRIYVKSMLALAAAMPVHGFAHITGGGLTDNIPRVLPDGLRGAPRSQPLAARSAVRLAARARARIAPQKCIAPSTAASAWSQSCRRPRNGRRSELLRAQGETAMRIGTIAAGSGGVLIR